VNPSGPEQNDFNFDDATPERAAHHEARSNRADESRPSALCVGFDCISSVRIGDLLERSAIDTIYEGGLHAALAHVVGGRVDIVIVCDTTCFRELSDFTAKMRRVAPAVKVVVAGDAPTNGHLLQAVRAGASDWLDFGSDEADMHSRIDAALELGREERRRDERIARLKGICRNLSVTRGEFSKQIDSLSEGLSHAMSDARERLDEAAIVGEFRGLLSQELDVEDLLRTSLQYMLTKTGATNAAVFLPGSKPTQFGLGAYVHYDCPRASAQPLLARLASDVCPRLATTDDIVRFADTEEFVDSLGVEATVLEDSELVAWPARHGDECMGVFFLFRNKSEPFRDELASLIDALRPVFATQMAKLVRVHHRSKFVWPESGAESTDDEGDRDSDEGENWRRAA